MGSEAVAQTEEPESYDDLLEMIRGLTRRQQDVLGMVAMGQDEGQPRKTMETLERMGLLTSWKETVPGWPPVQVKRYGVTVRVHMAYCHVACE